jgi:hypothetical protein
MKSLQQTEADTLRVLRLAVEGAADKHRRMGVPMVIWKNGRIEEILPKSNKSQKRFGGKSKG